MHTHLMPDRQAKLSSVIAFRRCSKAAATCHILCMQLALDDANLQQAAAGVADQQIPGVGN